MAQHSRRDAEQGQPVAVVDPSGNFVVVSNADTQDGSSFDGGERVQDGRGQGPPLDSCMSDA